MRLEQLTYNLAHFRHWGLSHNTVHILATVCKIVKLQLRVHNKLDPVIVHRLKTIDNLLKKRGHTQLFVSVYKKELGPNV
jgi:hypothetical protein